MRKSIVTFLVLAAILVAIPAFAQVAINTSLTSGQMTGTVANTYRTAYLQFQLVNCGDNVPVLQGKGTAVVQDSFNLYPITPGSAIVGSILGNDQMSCGNVLSTYYVVTPMKDASHPLRAGIPYVICSASSALTTCSNSASLGTFDITTADPMTQPPPVPGFSQLYENPTNNQAINQPSGTSLQFLGNYFCGTDGPTPGLCTFDFTGATVIGLPGGTGTSVQGTPGQVTVTQSGNTATVSLASPTTIPVIVGPTTFGPGSPAGVSALLLNTCDPFGLFNNGGIPQWGTIFDFATGTCALYFSTGSVNQRIFTTAFQGTPYTDGSFWVYNASQQLPAVVPNTSVNSQNGIMTAPASILTTPTDTGTANAYVACVNNIGGTGQLKPGLTAYFVASNPNTAASTLNWCGSTPLPIRKASYLGMVALSPNDILTTPFIVKVVWDSVEWDDIEPANVGSSSGGVFYTLPGSYATNQGTNGNADPLQGFSCDAYHCTLLIGSFSTAPCCSNQFGETGIGPMSGLNSVQHLTHNNGQNGQIVDLNTGDDVGDMAAGATGTAGSPAVRQQSPAIITPTIYNGVAAYNFNVLGQTGDILKAGPGLGLAVTYSATTGTCVGPTGTALGEVMSQVGGGSSTFVEISPAGNLILTSPIIGTASGSTHWIGATSGCNFTTTGTPTTAYCQYTATSGFIQKCYGSDGTEKISYGSASDNHFYSETQTVAHGTAALGTSAIASGACATVVTVSATGVLSTDNILADFNADPSSTTGYNPSTGVLTIYKYPSTNDVNFKVCNATASSITPGAVTLNWRVTR